MNNAVSSDNLFADLKAKAAEGAVPNVEPVEEEAVVQPTELDTLKNRARVMGLVFSNNIGLDALRAKVQAKLDGVVEKKEEPVVEDEAPKALTAQQERDKMFADQMKLIRLRITNLNPSKKDLPGEIFTFANRVLGSVRKFVPYGEQTENGYHVPYCIYQMMKEREFVNIKTRKDSKGRTIVEQGMAREFALEVLPMLTEVELGRLAAAQAAAAGND